MAKSNLSPVAKARLVFVAAALLMTFSLAVCPAPSYAAGSIWLTGTDAVSLHDDAVYTSQLLTNLKGSSALPILYVTDDFDSSGSTTVNGFPVFRVSTVTGQTLSNYSAIFFGSPGGCCNDPATNSSLGIAANAAGIAAFIAAGGNVAIEDYRGNAAWIPILGFDGSPGVVPSFGEPGISTVAGQLFGFVGNGRCHPTPPNSYCDGAFDHQAYDIGWFAGFGFTDLIDGTNSDDPAAVLTNAIPSSPDSLKAAYYDVSTSAKTSAAGYGGPGSSGGAGDNTVRLVNPTAGNGTLCAMIYVFDDNEELQACCGCPITPDGLRTFSTLNDLTLDFGVNKGNLNQGVIEVVSSLPNFSPGTPPPGPTPAGTNGVCSPTGFFANDTFGRVKPVTPTPGLRGWITHDELQEPGNIAGGKAARGASVEEFQDAPPFPGDAVTLQSRCATLIQNGSGSGICTCGVGDSGVSGGSVRAR